MNFKAGKQLKCPFFSHSEAGVVLGQRGMISNNDYYPILLPNLEVKMSYILKSFSQTFLDFWPKNAKNSQFRPKKS